MEAGRKLDALIAKHVFDKSSSVKDDTSTMTCDVCGKVYHSYEDELSYYSTDIVAAWMVVEKIKESSFSLYRLDDSHWECEVDSNDGSFLLTSPSVNVFATGNTAPHAICLAALKARGIEV